MSKRCKKCGNVTDHDDRFCVRCGTEYSEEIVSEDEKSSFPEVWIVLLVALVVMILVAFVFSPRGAYIEPEGTWFCENDGTTLVFNSDGEMNYLEKSVVYVGNFKSDIGHKGHCAQVMNEETDDCYILTFSRSGDSMIVYKNVSGNRAVLSIFILKKGRLLFFLS